MAARSRARSFADKSELAGSRRAAHRQCTGVGAKALFGDPELTPLKGQITLSSRNRPSPTPISIRYSISTCFRAATAWCLAAAMNSATGRPMSDPRRAAQILEGHSLIVGRHALVRPSRASARCKSRSSHRGSTACHITPSPHPARPALALRGGHGARRWRDARTPTSCSTKRRSHRHHHVSRGTCLGW